MTSLHRSTSAPRRRLPTGHRLLLWILAGVLPAMLLIAWLAASSDVPAAALAAAAFAGLAWTLIVVAAVRSELLGQVRTLSNLVEAARTQDHSMKGARAREPGELGELYRQINQLTESLKVSRQSEQELLRILERVVSEIDVAIFVFDAHGRVRLANERASALMKVPVHDLIGMRRSDTVLEQLPASPEAGVIDFRFPGASGRWQVRQHSYRQQGEVGSILFVADLKRVLVGEEVATWQRLIRVISHEVNNSLTPMMSLCQTLTTMLAKSGHDGDDDVREGLGVIAERARGLQEFIGAYARLVRLPEPRKELLSAADLGAKLQHIFNGERLEIRPFPPITLFGDPVHLEQALINLIKNGLEANPHGAPPVCMSCEVHDGQCEFQIADHGAGIANPDNLFVPFYTTKPQGTGIGLALCRQIAARHHGYVSLENRPSGAGATARLILPLPPREAVGSR